MEQVQGLWHQTPPQVRQCCRALWHADHAAHPVGGCMRDLLLGVSPKDWDIATSALPEAVMALFAHTVPTGLRHGTVTVLLDDMPLEVTTFRREVGYADGRRPDHVCFDVGLREDLARRDFTINAMALERDGTVADPFGGQGDLAAQVVRCVGEADLRFQEDALRMLRGLRFAARLGFALEEETARAIVRNAAGLDRVSAERVKAELERILCSARPELAALPVKLGMLARFGAVAQEVNLAALRDLPPEREERWRAFCHITGLDITRLPVERAIRRAVLRPDGPVPALTGRDLYQLGLRRGDIGRAKRRLEEHIADYPEDNERKKLLKVIEPFLPQEN